MSTSPVTATDNRKEYFGLLKPDKLATLAESARVAAEGARTALFLDGKEARRERYLNYGRALLPIKEYFGKDDRGFSRYLKETGLEVSTRTFRGDAMWLARGWEEPCAQNSVHMCPYSNPVDIRTWLRRQRWEEEHPDHIPEFDALIKPTDNWNFDKPRYLPDRTKEGYGYIPGDLYANCLFYWTRPGDHVVAPMAGTGQILKVYRDRATWMRPAAWDLHLDLFDLTPQTSDIRQNDLLLGLPVEHADYIVMDVPYLGIVQGQYSGKPEDLANMDTVKWTAAIERIALVCRAAQRSGDLCTVIVTNNRTVYGDSETVLATALVREAFSQAGYVLHDIAYAARRIQQAQNPAIAQTNNEARRKRCMQPDMAEVQTFVCLSAEP
jgi:ParB family chromosome partitioning protein